MQLKNNKKCYLCVIIYVAFDKLMKKLFATLAFAALALGSTSHSAMAQNKLQNKPQVELQSATDSVSYALGVHIGETIRLIFARRIINPDILSHAIMEYLEGEATMNFEQAGQYIRHFSENIQDTLLGNENQRKGYEFFSELADREDITSTNSGLYYKILNRGKGETIKDGDEVVMEFVVTNIEGRVLDSTKDHGKPFEFAFKRGNFIEGCYEGLKYARKGTKIILYIPYELAYGENGSGIIEPKETLIFEVEILDITKAEK